MREQVSVFLYTMGDVADDLLTTMNVQEETATYDELIAAFNNHFNERKNKIHARAKFNKRVQKTGEEVDSFIQDLHRIGEECQYGALKEELIRDRIVVGVTDDNSQKEGIAWFFVLMMTLFLLLWETIP